MKFRLRGKIVFVGCRNIPDTVYVKMDPTAAFWKRGAEIKVMIYRANNIQHAVVMNNHMLVGIDGQHFVTKLTPVKKDDLKQQKVWQMEQIK
jgi:ssDNA-binding Zn-finger/Zn-ribbon topoisomerase 1